MGEGLAPAAVVLSKVWTELPHDWPPFTPELLHNRVLPGSRPLQQIQQLLASAGWSHNAHKLAPFIMTVLPASAVWSHTMHTSSHPSL
jgi:hypothetical protein